jgi:hypothetical protein
MKGPRTCVQCEQNQVHVWIVRHWYYIDAARNVHACPATLQQKVVTYCSGGELSLLLASSASSSLSFSLSQSFNEQQLSDLKSPRPPCHCPRDMSMSSDVSSISLDESSSRGENSSSQQSSLCVNS